jgi:hypothetical protein
LGGLNVDILFTPTKKADGALMMAGRKNGLVNMLMPEQLS